MKLESYECYQGSPAIDRKEIKKAKKNVYHNKTKTTDLLGGGGGLSCILCRYYVSKAGVGK